MWDHLDREKSVTFCAISANAFLRTHQLGLLLRDTKRKEQVVEEGKENEEDIKVIGWGREKTLPLYGT